MIYFSRHSKKTRLAALLLCGLAASPIPGFATPTGPTSATVSVQQPPGHLPQKPDDPQYIMTLTLAEYSMFNNALIYGLKKYGGKAEMELAVANYPNTDGGPWWIVSAKEPGALQAYSAWAAKQLVSVVRDANFNALDAGTTSSMHAITTLVDKLQAAQDNPVWQTRVLSGTLTMSGESPYLQLGTDILPLADVAGKTTSSMNGKQVSISGSYRQPGSFHLDAIAPVTTDTLEVFTMSHCPYGQQIVPVLINYVASKRDAAGVTPKLNVHYILYKISDDSASGYFTLHGSAEMLEDVIQIIIRDNYSSHFFDYLMARTSNPDNQWKDLAKQVGITDPQLLDIETQLQNNARSIIEAEYRYTHDLSGVTDRSPTYMLNGNQITDPKQAPGFEDYDPSGLPAGACSQ